MSATLLAEAVRDAGVPDGVYNVTSGSAAKKVAAEQ